MLSTHIQYEPRVFSKIETPDAINLELLFSRYENRQNLFQKDLDCCSFCQTTFLFLVHHENIAQDIQFLGRSDRKPSFPLCSALP
jgi:hypothetical protein